MPEVIPLLCANCVKHGLRCMSYSWTFLLWKGHWQQRARRSRIPRWKFTSICRIDLFKLKQEWEEDKAGVEKLKFCKCCFLPCLESMSITELHFHCRYVSYSRVSPSSHGGHFDNSQGNMELVRMYHLSFLIINVNHIL